jgi:hypothetical protein
LQFYAYYKIGAPCMIDELSTETFDFIATETDAEKIPKKADRPGFANLTGKYKW